MSYLNSVPSKVLNVRPVALHTASGRDSGLHLNLGRDTTKSQYTIDLLELNSKSSLWTRSSGSKRIVHHFVTFRACFLRTRHNFRPSCEVNFSGLFGNADIFDALFCWRLHKLDRFRQVVLERIGIGLRTIGALVGAAFHSENDSFDHQ
jgi:hypothetical protein